MTTDNIDYKDLLWKYMSHVGEEEGITYLLYAEDHVREGSRFSPEELKALKEIDAMPSPVGKGWRSRKILPGW